MTRPSLFAATLPARARHGLLIALLALAGCAGTTPHEAPPPPAIAQPAAVVAPATTPEPSTPAAKPESVALDEANIFFAPGSTTVDASGAAKLHRHATFLKENRKRTVTLVGHTSTAGSRSFNLATTDQRVAAVSKLLRSDGVWARQIRPHSVIRESVPAGCRTAECSIMTRRVELRYAP